MNVTPEMQPLPRPSLSTVFLDLISDNANGLVVVHARERPVQDVFEFEDFCSLTCIRCEYEHDEFPKYFVFDQQESQSLSCSKV